MKANCEKLMIEKQQCQNQIQNFSLDSHSQSNRIDETGNLEPKAKHKKNKRKKKGKKEQGREEMKEEFRVNEEIDKERAQKE